MEIPERAVLRKQQITGSGIFLLAGKFRSGKEKVFVLYGKNCIGRIFEKK